jgi:hypothetical protein
MPKYDEKIIIFELILTYDKAALETIKKNIYL